MKKGTNENAKRINTRNQFGEIDLTDEGRARRVSKVRANIAKPYKGMKWFEEYNCFAINETSARRKAGKDDFIAKPVKNTFSNKYPKLAAYLRARFTKKQPK